MINPFALFGLQKIAAYAIGAAAVALAVWAYGAWEYTEGREFERDKYEKIAIAAEAERQAVTRERFRQGELAQGKFNERAKATEVALARSRDALDILVHTANELRDAAASRGAGTVEPGDTCRAERERIAEGERLLVEGASRVGSCNRLVVEGQRLHREAADRLDLAIDHIEALNVGAPQP